MPDGRFGIERPLVQCNLGVRVDIGVNGRVPSRPDQIDINRLVSNTLKSELPFIDDVGVSFDSTPSLEFSQSDWVMSVVAITGESELSADSLGGESSDVDMVKSSIEGAVAEAGFNIVRKNTRTSVVSK